MLDGAEDGGPRPWQDGVDPDLRRSALVILGKLLQASYGKHAPCYDITSVAASFEQKMFSEAESQEDYIKRISQMLYTMERSQQWVLQVASGPNQQVSPTMSSHESQLLHMRSLPITSSGLCPVQEQNMANPVAPIMHTNNRQTEALPMSSQIFRTSLPIVSWLAPGVHPSQIMMQPGETHTQKKLQDIQMQPITFSSANATSVPQSQGQPLAQPNGHQNLLSQNSTGTCTLPQQWLRMNQQGPQVNPQKMNKHNKEILAAKQANVRDMHTGHPRELNSQQTYKHRKMETQPMDVLQHLITVNQQSSLQTAIPQTVASTGSVEEVDWREETFQQIKTLKDAYLSKLTELYQFYFISEITKEEFESLSKEESEKYRYKLHTKNMIGHMLNFLQFEKSDITENLRGWLPILVKGIPMFLSKEEDQMEEMYTRWESKILHSEPQSINLTGSTINLLMSTSLLRAETTHPPADMQMQPITFSSANATSVPQSQGQPLVQSNGHQNLLSQNSTGTCTLPQQQLRMNQQGPQVNPQKMNKNNITILAAKQAIVRDMHTGHPREQNSQHNAGMNVGSLLQTYKHRKMETQSMDVLQHLITVNQQSSLQTVIPQTVALTGSVEEVDWREEMFQQIKTLKDAYLSNLTGLYQLNFISEITKEEFESLSKEESEKYRYKAYMTKRIGNLLNFLHLEKSNIPEHFKGRLHSFVEVISMVLAKKVQMEEMYTPLLWAETTHLSAEDLQHGRAETPVGKKPIDRLINAVRSLSSAELKRSANSICMDDWVAHGEFDTFQQQTFFPKQGGSSSPNKIKSIFEITASCCESAPIFYTWEDETNLEHGANRQKAQSPSNALLEEIESANSMLINTIASIAYDNVTDGITASSGGTLIVLSYSAVSLAPDLKSLFATSETPIIMPTKLLVPADYPRSSPMLVTDERCEQQRNMFSDITGSVIIAFQNTINGISEPRSIIETVRAWDTCVQQAVVEFSQQLGGGMFSSWYGGWESSGSA